MFQRVLVVLDDTQSRHCVYNTALGFAKSNHAQLCLVDRAEAKTSDRELIKIAQDWNADLILVERALMSEPGQLLPCSILIVQQSGNSTISMTMQIKPKPVDWEVRARLEKLLELTPKS